MRTPGSRLALIAGAVVALAASTYVLTGHDPSPTSDPDASRAARRVVSLVPAATEILFAIGAGDRLVGRTHWGVHPPAARDVPDVGDGIRPSLEAVLARRPDLVVLVAGSDNAGVAERLEALGVRTLPITHNTLADLERNTRALGDAVGCRGSADLLARRVRAGLAAVARERPGRPVRVYYDVWPDPPMTIGRGSYLDSLLTLAGGRNVFGHLGAPSPQVSLEAIVRADPEVVVFSATSGGVPPDERPGWEHIPAVAAGHVAGVDGDLLGRLGPRVADAALQLARAIHGAPPDTVRSGPAPALACAP